MGMKEERPRTRSGANPSRMGHIGLSPMAHEIPVTMKAQLTSPTRLKIQVAGIIEEGAMIR
jgi:hypothetical protein